MTKTYEQVKNEFNNINNYSNTDEYFEKLLRIYRDNKSIIINQAIKNVVKKNKKYE